MLCLDSTLEGCKLVRDDAGGLAMLCLDSTLEGCKLTYPMRFYLDPALP